MPPEYQPLRDQLATSEANLRESQELFAKSFHNSPALMTIAALPGGEFVEVNQAFLDGVQLPRESVLGRTTLDLNLWRDTSQREIFFQQISAAVSVRDFEAEFNTGSGQLRFYLLNADRIELKGRPCILTVAVDITERRRRVKAEEALAAVERRYRDLFENAAEGFYLSSVDGRFIEVNPTLARMLGYSDSTTCITAINQIEHEIYVDPGRRQAFFDELAAGDRITDFESEIRRADGSTFWVSESVRAVRNTGHDIDHLEGVAVDITARREVALALAEARDAADAANRAKSQFLASMSHELRTPLNGILGFTQILGRAKDLPAEHQHGVAIIHESAEHLLGLINDVLDLSKVEAGRLELHPGSFDPTTLLAGVVELLGPRARTQGLTFTPEIAGNLPSRVISDSARLKQVLLNLIANALKFTANGGITLAASCPPQEDLPPDHSLVRFSVRDTGCGIASDDFSDLFEPFKQLGHTALRAEGTGLGLAISHKLVAALGGSLQVESTLGAGSHFWFDLVLPHGAETMVPFESQYPIIGYEGPGRRVLIVDDLSANADVLRGLLEPLGFSVDLAATGEDAIASISTQPVDLVLMDLRMPGMGGLEAIKVLRADAANRDLRIIAVSASAYNFDRATALGEGCDDFLPKPVRADALFESVGRVLGLTWSRRSPATGTPIPFTESVEPPPAAEIEALYQLALAGDVVALRQRAESLTTHPEFGQMVNEMARGFKLKALRGWLETWHTDSPNHD